MGQPEVIKKVQDNRKFQLRAVAQTARAQLVALDREAIAVWQQRQITDEEFRAITGKTPQDALRQLYNSDLVSADLQMRNRVEAGNITAKDYETITGKSYDFGAEQMVSAAVEALQAAVRTIAPETLGNDAVTEKAEAEAEATKADSSKKAKDGTTAS